MDVNPGLLADHLARIHFGAGPRQAHINDVVLRGAFECTAKSGDGSLVVAAPPLRGVDTLPEDLGVDLHRLIGVLRPCGQYDPLGKWVYWPAVTMTFGTRLVIRPAAHVPLPQGYRPEWSLVRHRPEGQPHNLDPESAAALIGAVLFHEAETRQFELTLGGLVLPDVEGRERVGLSAEGEDRSAEVVHLGEIADATVTLRGDPSGRDSAVLAQGLDGMADFLLPIPDWKPSRALSVTLPARPFARVLTRLRAKPAEVKAYMYAPDPGRPVLFATSDGYRYLIFGREAGRTVLP